MATVHDEADLHELSLSGQAVTFDLDSYKLLIKALHGRDKQHRKILELPAIGAPDVLMP